MKSGSARARRLFDVECTVDIEHSASSLHAHVELDGIELLPGDQVLVRDADTRVRFGERRRMRATATVRRASWLHRHWVQVCSVFHITSLYEVSFSSRRAL
jgi:hypothetical protein